jgi:hypothetical protein
MKFGTNREPSGNVDIALQLTDHPGQDPVDRMWTDACQADPVIGPDKRADPNYRFGPVEGKNVLHYGISLSVMTDSPGMNFLGTDPRQQPERNILAVFDEDCRPYAAYYETYCAKPCWTFAYHDHKTASRGHTFLHQMNVAAGCEKFKFFSSRSTAERGGTKFDQSIRRVQFQNIYALKGSNAAELLRAEISKCMKLEDYLIMEPTHDFDLLVTSKEKTKNTRGGKKRFDSTGERWTVWLVFRTLQLAREAVDLVRKRTLMSPSWVAKNRANTRPSPVVTVSLWESSRCKRCSRQQHPLSPCTCENLTIRIENLTRDVGPFVIDKIAGLFQRPTRTEVEIT